MARTSALALVVSAGVAAVSFASLWRIEHRRTGPVWALALMLAVLGFCLGVGQPLSTTTVVQAAPDEAR